MSYTVASIIPRITARLNDPNQDIFTTPALLPYVQDAGDELQLALELNGILVLEKISIPIVVPAGTLKLNGLLPIDMYEPQRIEERLSGSTDQFMEMTRRQWEPDVLPTDSLRYWTYREENIYFVGATQARDIRIYFLKHLINIADPTSVIGVNNSQQFMISRSAALAARYIGENPERADTLDACAKTDLDMVIRIGVKSKQGARTRRRPYVLVGTRRWI